MVWKPLISLIPPFEQYCWFLKISQQLCYPTHITANSQSLIDLFLSALLMQGNCETIYCDISALNAILARLLTPSSRQQPTPPQLCRKSYRVNWEAFKDNLRTCFTVSLDQDVDNTVNFFTISIISVLDQHAPLVVRRNSVALALGSQKNSAALALGSQKNS